MTSNLNVVLTKTMDEIYMREEEISGGNLEEELALAEMKVSVLKSLNTMVCLEEKLDDEMDMYKETGYINTDKDYNEFLDDMEMTAEEFIKEHKLENYMTVKM